MLPAPPARRVCSVIDRRRDGRCAPFAYVDLTIGTTVGPDVAVALLAVGGCDDGLVMIGGCDASSSSTLRTQSIAVAVDRVYITPDRRTVVVFAGTDPLGSCLAADNGASVTVSEGVLVVEARRLVSGAPPSTCLPMCMVAKSTVMLAEPLAPDISFARSPPGAVATCSSSLDPTAAIPIELCRPAVPTP